MKHLLMYFNRVVYLADVIGITGPKPLLKRIFGETVMKFDPYYELLQTYTSKPQ